MRLVRWNSLNSWRRYPKIPFVYSTKLPWMQVNGWTRCVLPFFQLSSWHTPDSSRYELPEESNVLRWCSDFSPLERAVLVATAFLCQTSCRLSPFLTSLPPPPLPHPAIYCTISVCFMMLSFFYSCSYFFLSCIPTGNIVLNCVLNTAILNCKYINKRNIIMQVTQSLQHKNIQFTLTMEKTALIIESSNNEEQKWYQQKRILKRRRALVQGAKLCRIMWCVFQRLRSLGWIRILSRAEQKTGNSSVWLWWCTLRSFFVRTANAMWDWWCARLLYPAFFKKSSPFSL